jgi:hypothetical protein
MKREINISILTVLLLVASCAGFADGGKNRGVAPVKNPSYVEECSSCHFAYQPGLLPSRSWEKIMSNLGDHFGDNAELDAPIRKELLRYLVDNGADRSNYRRSKKIMRTIGVNDAPMQITKVSYFKRKHDELSNRMVAANPKVVSLGNCGACHTKADTGSFSEREIDIPGFGAWHD